MLRKLKNNKLSKDFTSGVKATSQNTSAVLIHSHIPTQYAVKWKTNLCFLWEESLCLTWWWLMVQSDKSWYSLKLMLIHIWLKLYLTLNIDIINISIHSSGPGIFASQTVVTEELRSEMQFNPEWNGMPTPCQLLQYTPMRKSKRILSSC